MAAQATVGAVTNAYIGTVSRVAMGRDVTSETIASDAAVGAAGPVMLPAVAYTLASTLSVATAVNKAVFYSGKGARDAAIAYTEHRGGGGMIDGTTAGVWLEKLYLYQNLHPLMADQFWGIASKRFASEAKGEVTTFAKNAAEKRVFLSIEKPILEDGLKTGRVTAIVERQQ